MLWNSIQNLWYLFSSLMSQRTLSSDKAISLIPLHVPFLALPSHKEGLGTLLDALLLEVWSWILQEAKWSDASGNGSDLGPSSLLILPACIKVDLCQICASWIVNALGLTWKGSNVPHTEEPSSSQKSSISSPQGDLYWIIMAAILKCS